MHPETIKQVAEKLQADGLAVDEATVCAVLDAIQATGHSVFCVHAATMWTPLHVNAAAPSWYPRGENLCRS